MIYVTGDTHGDLSRFSARAVRRLKKGDTLIVLGDFGFLWTGGAAEQRVLKKLAKQRYTLAFVDGSHENFSLLSQYPEEEFAGGRAQRLGGRLYRLLRGEVYTLEGRTLLAFGGGESLDRESREENVTWWPEELPGDADYARAQKNIDAHGGAVDYIVTHDAPSRLLAFLNLNRDTVLYEENALERYFDGLMHGVRFRHWYFGRYHLDQNLGPTADAVYRRVLPLWKPERRRIWRRRDAAKPGADAGNGGAGEKAPGAEDNKKRKSSLK